MRVPYPLLITGGLEGGGSTGRHHPDQGKHFGDQGLGCCRTRYEPDTSIGYCQLKLHLAVWPAWKPNRPGANAIAFPLKSSVTPSGFTIVSASASVKSKNYSPYGASLSLTNRSVNGVRNLVQTMHGNWRRTTRLGETVKLQPHALSWQYPANRCSLSRGKPCPIWVCWVPTLRIVDCGLEGSSIFGMHVMLRASWQWTSRDISPVKTWSTQSWVPVVLAGEYPSSGHEYFYSILTSKYVNPSTQPSHRQEGYFESANWKLRKS